MVTIMVWGLRVWVRHVSAPREIQNILELSLWIPFLPILFFLGLLDLGIYRYCISITIYRCGRCDYNVLCELVPIVLFKKPIVIQEKDLSREK